MVQTQVETSEFGKASEATRADTADLDEAAGNRLERAHSADVAWRQNEERRLRRRWEWVTEQATNLQCRLLGIGLVLLVVPLWPHFWAPPLPGIPWTSLDRGDRLRLWMLAGCLALVSGALVYVFARREEAALRVRAAELGFDLEATTSACLAGDRPCLASSDHARGKSSG